MELGQLSDFLAQSVRIMFWENAHLPPFPNPRPGIPPLECYCSQITFQAVLKPLSLSPNGSVAAVTLENEALLYAFFIVFAAVMARIFAIYCERSFPKQTFIVE